MSLLSSREDASLHHVMCVVGRVARLDAVDVGLRHAGLCLLYFSTNNITTAQFAAAARAVRSVAEPVHAAVADPRLVAALRAAARRAARGAARRAPARRAPVAAAGAVAAASRRAAAVCRGAAAAASNRRLAPWVHGAMGSVLHASRLQHGLVAPPVVAYDAATSATVMPSAEATVMPGAIGDDATIVAAAQQQQHYREAAAATSSSLRQPPMVVPTSSLSVAESVFGSRASAAATRRPKARPKVLELSAAHAVGACTSRAGSRAGFPPPPPATVHPTAFRSVADERAAAKDWEEGVPARRPPDRPTAASELKRAHGPVGFAGSADSLVGSWAQSPAAVGGGGNGSAYLGGVRAERRSAERAAQLGSELYARRRQSLYDRAGVLPRSSKQGY